MMPFQPPTRPHSANPLASLYPSIFPRSATPASSSSVHPQPRSLRGVSGSLLGRMSREAEWEDAWDSSSDREDNVDHDDISLSSPPRPARGVPIPPRSSTTELNVQVASSWASTSFQHVSPPSKPAHRPVLSPSKTYAEGMPMPAPGTTVSSPTSPTRPTNGVATGSKLPPGGAWEVVESTEVKPDNVVHPVQVGKEAVRDDADEILKGWSMHI